uniref:Uncharacterized protein n=1 Tax=Globisporangium ultimum (strain ATCC 200006 / CBS 805.95 / DAOM BR144) TaxID=431595 RepID=K3WW67_GLOUD
MEVLLIRIDLLRDRKQYTSILKTWLQELEIANGRFITMGEVHLLFIAAESAKIDKLLEYYTSKEIDSNSQGELCVDKFIDIVGRKSIEGSGCKGFLEMNILNKHLLEKVLVHEWHGDLAWLELALSTPRTKALLAWREAAKAARKDRRKKSAQDRDATKLVKKQQAETEAATKAAAKANGEAQSDEDEDDDKEEEKQEQTKPAPPDDGDKKAQPTAEAEKSDKSVSLSETKPPPAGPATFQQKQQQQLKKRRRNQSKSNQKQKQQRKAN